MKDVNAYIESGILELHVLGQLNAAEEREVLEMATQYPEIKTELDAIEVAMEKYAHSNSIDPGKKLDLSLFDNSTPRSSAPRVIPMGGSSNKVRMLSYALAACVALLVVSFVLLYSAHDRLDSTRSELTQLQLEKQQYTRNANYMQQQLDELQLLTAMPSDPNWAQVKLKGVGKFPDSKLEIYWNKQDNKVMVNNHNKALPEHDASHQYQLWAIVGGKPVDLGVFDGVTDSSKVILQMKNVQGAQAFAVTIEKHGGSPTPNMDMMVVMGGV